MYKFVRQSFCYIWYLGRKYLYQLSPLLLKSINPGRRWKELHEITLYLHVSKKIKGKGKPNTVTWLHRCAVEVKLVNIYLPLDLFSHFPVDLFSSNAAFTRLIPVSLAPTEHRVIATQEQNTKNICIFSTCSSLIFLSFSVTFTSSETSLLAVKYSEEVRHPKVLIKSSLKGMFDSGKV